MHRVSVFHLMVAAVFCFGAMFNLAAQQQKSGDQEDNLDVRSTLGDLHLGKDADAAKAGLPVYPGARPKQDKDNDPLNFGVLTESFGFKIVMAKYESDDGPGKILAFYRDKLKKYGKILECHSTNDDTDFDFDDDEAHPHPKELKCEGNNSGPVTELKAGTQDNERMVAIEPADGKKGSTFTIVYLYKRGKKADI
jgi:hypothetical protein